METKGYGRGFWLWDNAGVVVSRGRGAAGEGSLLGADAAKGQLVGVVGRGESGS